MVPKQDGRGVVPGDDDGEATSQWPPSTSAADADAGAACLLLPLRLPQAPNDLSDHAVDDLQKAHLHLNPAAHAAKAYVAEQT